MLKINCIVVDDSVSSKVMTSFISRTSSLSLAGYFASAIDAVNFLLSKEAENIGIVFLDIEMPEMSGIEFMRTVDLSHIEVIIYSSQEKYALESYEYDVCDYLLKPVSYARFIKSVNKAKLQIDQKGSGVISETAKNVVENDTRPSICLKDINGQTHKIHQDDIALIQAMENYIKISTPYAQLTIHMTMKRIMDLLSTDEVVRVHRSFAVGRRYVVRASADEVVAQIGTKETKMPLSRTYRVVIKSLMEGKDVWSEG